ncbi:MAG: hypothetical protein KAX49_07155 [Halanaerobiales bacterium]|nr:hypothetical protein [Halanaerobiales bacterium]
MNKTKISWGKVLLASIIVFTIMITVIICVYTSKIDAYKELLNDKEIKYNILKYEYQNIIDNLGAIEESISESKLNIPIEEKDSAQAIKIGLKYRLTHYYTGDNTGSSNYVGAGLKTSQFQVNNKGWYTYKGRLVLAAATNECLNSKSGACNKWNTKQEGIHYYNYYDEVLITIDGIEYDGIILDSCGSAMTEPRLDLFISNRKYAIDRHNVLAVIK